MVHADDLALDLHQQLAKGRSRDQLSFGCSARSDGRAQPRDERAHAGAVAAQEQVDAFVGQQHRALERRARPASGCSRARRGSCSGVKR
jgi:hypothetical protein